MNNIEKLQKILEKLHEINFGEQGIIRPISGGKDYNFHHECGKDFVHEFDTCNKDSIACTECDNYKLSDDKRFTYVAHGAHTLDFIEAHKFVNDHEEKSVDLTELENWSTMPVMFVMENPANSKGNNYFGDSSYSRLPTKSWFWLNSNYKKCVDEYVFPNLFEMGAYGGLVFSIINTFHIANGYLTDSVKCGIGKRNNLDYITSTADYDHKIIKQCVEKHLQRELDALRSFDKNKRAIVFAFGDNAYYNIVEFLPPERNNFSIVKLPHPRNRISNEYRKYVLFAIIAKTLHENKFYNDSSAGELNYMDILSNDFVQLEEHKNVSPLTVREVEKFLQEIVGDSNCVQKDGYEDGVYTWKTPGAKKPNKNVDRVIVKYRKPSTSTTNHKEDYKVFWAQYDIQEDLIDFWRGKKKSEADEYVKEPEIYGQDPLYQIMEQLQKRVKARG